LATSGIGKPRPPAAELHREGAILLFEEVDLPLPFQFLAAWLGIWLVRVLQQPID
jgi:hypothetical protein